MIKVVSNDSFNWGDEPLGALVKMSSKGLIGEDRRDFEKRAAADLLSKVAQIKTKPGEELVHLIALGDTEHYGPNRNGDGFSKKACEDYHDYFVKEARVYRNHKNTDPEKSYGVVKASAYNDDMHRVELIVALNATKEAAAANKGLVADKEMDKMEKDGNFAVSMACFLDPNYPILVKDKGYISIEDVRVGMEVWTKEARWRKVTLLNRRQYTGKVVEITFDNFNYPTRVTADHLFWATDRETTENGWIAAENLHAGMLIAVSVPDPKFLLDGCADKYQKIKSLVYSTVEDRTTYNFEVEEDASYSAAGLISHNCRVPFDVCSCCGNKAKTRKDYCKDVKDGGHCKAGGLDKNLGKMASVNGEIQQLYADNTKPYFFDISHVFVPADRTAYTSGFLTKHASASMLSGSDLASMYGIQVQPEKTNFTVAVDGNYENALNMLKDATVDFHSGELWKRENPYLAVFDSSGIKEAEALWQHNTPAVTKAMFDQHICLTPTQFIQWETGLPFEKAAQVGEIIGPLSNDAFVDILVSNDRYNPYLPGDSTNSHLRTWCNQQKCARWDYGKGMQKQAAINSIVGIPEMELSREAVYSLSDDAAAQEYSRRFALYKAAFVLSQPKEHQRSIAELLIGRDYLSR